MMLPYFSRQNQPFAAQMDRCCTFHTGRRRWKGGSPIQNPINNHNTNSQKIYKRIGNTNYEVSIHFSQTSKETLEDKVLRLMVREAKNLPLDVPQIALTAQNTKPSKI